MVFVRPSGNAFGAFACLALAALLAVTPAAAICGDSVVQPGEDCDDGGNNGSLNSCCTTSCTFSGESPDVIVGELPNTSRYGTLNGITAYSIGTTSCNLGSCWLKWISGTAEHPVIGQNMFRLKDGRFEHVGQSWLKHGFTALQGTVCSTGCQPSGTGSRLGVNCSDPYDSSLNGSQTRLGPKVDVDPSSGTFPYPDARIGTTGDVLFKRLQVRNTDLDPALNPGATYYVEGQYVTRDDAEAKNNNNNSSYRRVTVGAAPTFSLSLQGTTQRQKAGIQAWKATDPSVTETFVNAPDGLMILAAKATPLPGGTWHYEYALQNLTSHRGAQSFSVPLPPGAVVSNVGFHDVDYHSGEPFSGTDWAVTVTGNAVTWATQTFAENPNANALRWGTLYNFRFDANMAPGSSPIGVGMFRPGTPASISVTSVTPETCFSAPNGTACSDGNGCTPTDACQAGACMGTGTVVCTAMDDCHDAGVCDPGLGACTNPPKADGTACDDASACTSGDSCQSGVCTAAQTVICTASDSCHEVGTCDAGTGLCSNPPKADGAPCDDGDGCTQEDACASAVCIGSNPVVCTASDDCHDVGSCDPGSGLCSNPPKADGTACDDGSGCTANDACSSGVCTGDGVPVPGEVGAGVQLSHASGVTTLTWSPAEGATSSAVLRGLLGQFPVGPGGADEVCLDAVGESSITDAEDPAADGGFWYLVRGENSCGGGSYGSGLEGGVAVPRESATCP